MTSMTGCDLPNVGQRTEALSASAVCPQMPAVIAGNRRLASSRALKAERAACRNEKLRPNRADCRASKVLPI
jgi:hypothetical protein